jgi:hypothetical protein
MTNPQLPSRSANAPRTIVYGEIVTVTAVDTVTGICTLDAGDGSMLTEVLYLGRPPAAGDQVVLLTFSGISVVLGGSG